MTISLIAWRRLQWFISWLGLNIGLLICKNCFIGKQGHQTLSWFLVNFIRWHLFRWVTLLLMFSNVYDCKEWWMSPVFSILFHFFLATSVQYRLHNSGFISRPTIWKLIPGKIKNVSTLSVIKFFFYNNDHTLQTNN